MRKLITVYTALTELRASGRLACVNNTSLVTAARDHHTQPDGSPDEVISHAILASSEFRI
jgi:hypothetical protein